MKQSKQSGGIAVSVILLVVGLAVGAGITKAMDKSSSASASKVVASSATPAADLRAKLVGLGVEHMSLTSQAVDAALDGSPNAAAMGKALYANGDTLGATVGSVYGPSAEKTFDSVWKLHLDEFVKYAVADKMGDASGKQAALDAIQTGYTAPLADYLAKANPNFSKSTLESSLADHVDHTARMIDDHVKGDYTAEAADLTLATSHIQPLFSTLADGIVKQYPNKF